MFDPELIARAKRVRFLSCDVDGVLTDGRIYVDDHGHEFKAFCALDGVAMNQLARAGIIVAWITGSAAPAVTHRAQQLRIPHVVLDASEKLTPWQRMLRQRRPKGNDVLPVATTLPPFYTVGVTTMPLTHR